MSSELIDKIFDVQKIESEIKTIEGYLSGLKTEISGYAESVKKLMNNVRASKDVEGLAANSKKLNDTIVSGTKAVTEYGTAQKELEKQEKQLLQAKAKNLTATTNEVKELEVLKRSTKEKNDLIKIETVLNDKNAGSIEKAIAANKKLEIEKKKLNLETDKGKKRLAEINAEQDKNNKLIVDSGNKVQKQKANIGNYGSAFDGLLGPIRSAGMALKAFLANPVIAIVSGIVGAFKLLTSAMKRSEEGQQNLSKVTAGFKAGLNVLLDVITKVANFLFKAFENPKKSIADLWEFLKQNFINRITAIPDLFKGIFDTVANAFKFLGNKIKVAIADVPILGKNIDAEQSKKNVEDALNSMKENAIKTGQALIQLNTGLDPEQQKKIANSIKGVAKEIAEESKAAAELQSRRDKLKRAEREFIVEREKMKTTIEEAREAAANENIPLEERLKLNKQALELSDQLAAKEIQFAKEKAAILQAEVEMGESTSEQLEELERMKADIFIKEQERAKMNKRLLTEQRTLESRFEKEKADANKIEVEDFEKILKREQEAIQASYKQKETDLKKQFANGLISREKYEADLLKLQDKTAKEANDKTIEILQKQIESSELAADKKAELSNKIRDLQIENENLVLDATIEANEKKLENEKEVFEKRLQLAEQLAGAGMEVFNAIADFSRQQSENRLAEIEEEKAANDEYFQSRQENLDSAIMSEEQREIAQKKIDEEKAKREKQLADKAQAERIKQAKWEKAQALISATISTALAVVKMLADPAGTLGIILSIAAGIAGAAQIATIASQQIPAYEHGGVTKGEPASLWAEKRPEVAVTKTGDILFAEKPTVSKFDAGTRIYKSVEDFEKNMSISAGNGEKFDFDYDKMASKMPKTTINLDSSGLWGIVNKQNDRAITINRRCKLN